jgi:hypothetical protein
MQDTCSRQSETFRCRPRFKIGRCGGRILTKQDEPRTAIVENLQSIAHSDNRLTRALDPSQAPPLNSSLNSIISMNLRHGTRIACW